MFKILGLRDTQTGVFKHSVFRVMALCDGVTSSIKKAAMFIRISVSCSCLNQRFAQVSTQSPTREGEETIMRKWTKKKKTYFLGRRDVVDIGPERQRHG